MRTDTSPTSQRPPTDSDSGHVSEAPASRTSSAIGLPSSSSALSDPASDNHVKEARGSRKTAAYALSILFWIIVWSAAAFAVGNPLLLSSPLETFEAFAGALVTPVFWHAVGQTGFRILTTGLAGALCGSVAGFAAAHSELLRVLFAPLLQVMKSAPVACIVVIILVAAGAPGALAAIVVFVTVPPFYVAALQGQEARDFALEHVLRLAGVGPVRLFLCATWPALLPFFSAAAKTAVALSWKAGITAELLCIPLGSIGAAVYAAKLTLDTPALLMWTVVVMAFGWLSERVVTALLNATRDTPVLALSAHGRDRENARRDVDEGGRPVVGVEHATFSFGEGALFEDLTLTLRASERICLMAPTGTGKTTLVSLMIGIRRPQGGTAYIPTRAGVVPQRNALVESLSALDNVRLVCSDAEKESLEEELRGLLPEGTLNRRARDLSGGTRRLVEIARAAYAPGEALILDEPFTGLDTEAVKRACTFILRHLNGRPLLVVTHRAEDASLLGAAVVTLDECRRAA